MNLRIILIFAMSVFLISCESRRERKLEELKNSVYGEYEGTDIAEYWSVLGETDIMQSTQIYTIKASSGDFILINDVEAFIDESLSWIAGIQDTRYRAYRYEIVGDLLEVEYRTGGNGSGWTHVFKGRKQ